MKTIKALAVDVLIIVFATFVSIFLRDNFDLSHERAWELAPYILSTALASLVILPLFGVNRLIWRYSSLPDYLGLVGAMMAITIGALALTFLFNRLDDVPRSLPFIQLNAAVTLSIGLRVAYRLYHTMRRRRRPVMAPLKVVEDPSSETVLVVGLTALTEAYVQSVAQFAPQRIRIAGILSDQARHVGRMLVRQIILGKPEDIATVISDLKVRGVEPTKIIVTTPLASLSPTASEAIAAIEDLELIEVVYLSERLGLEAGMSVTPRANPLAFEIAQSELRTMRQRRYWTIKRGLDIALAVFLLIVMSPLILVVALCVALSVGRPLIFWQQRPGLGGRPFCLYKFRSMGAAYDADGHRKPDEERMSRIGSFLRRVRLDELPQLFNVISGDMSFVGPRPLLPCDQDSAYKSRLLVRPGLTGWAQVVGGRTIPAHDKTALDVWYVRNASLALDLKIILRTIPIILFGERISTPLIEAAWRDLRKAGVLRDNIDTGRTYDRAMV